MDSTSTSVTLNVNNENGNSIRVILFSTKYGYSTSVCFKRAKGKLVGDGNTIQVRNIHFQVRAAEVTGTPI